MRHDLEGSGIVDLPRDISSQVPTLDEGRSGTLRGVPGVRQHHGRFAAALSKPPHT